MEIIMASWIVHLRVADMLIDRLYIDIPHFVAGNIAPDCGLADRNGNFIPDMQITHFTKSGKGSCEYIKFWDEFCRNETDFKRHSFYLGYFVHLLTDVLWVKLINEPTKQAYFDLYSTDRTKYYKEVKSDWYDLDFLYLESNPNFRSWIIFCELYDFENTFLPYYEKDNFKIQFSYIKDFYNQTVNTNREYKYLTELKVNEFVDKASKIIINTIENL